MINFMIGLKVRRSADYHRSGILVQPVKCAKLQRNSVMKRLQVDLSGKLLLLE